MNLDDVKDQFRDQLDQSRRKIVESSAYAILKEKYDLLPQIAQNIVFVGIALSLLFIVLALPVSMLMTSSDELSQFDEQKQLIRQLLNADRELKQGPQVPSSLTPSAIESRIRSSIAGAGLLPEQIGEIQRTTAKVKSKTPKGVLTQGFLVTLSKLNLRQVTDLGYSMQSINSLVNLTQMSIESDSQDDHYFNVKFELAAFSIPKVQAPAPEPKGKKKRRGRRRKKRGGK